MSKPFYHFFDSADADLKASIIEAAQGLNFWRKQLDRVKRQVAEDVIDSLYLSDRVENTGEYAATMESDGDGDSDLVLTDDFIVSLVKWLTDNKPLPAKKAQIAKADLPISGGSLRPSQTKWRVKSGNKFILTCAQNNTDVHSAFLESLKTYAEYLGAELLISKFSYNKSGFQNTVVNGGEKDLWYDPSLADYLIQENVFLGDNKSVAFLAGLNILPTKVNPLQGIEPIIGNHNAIVPAAKHQLSYIAALKGELVREMVSTGTVTKRNYIQKIAGQQAEALHCYGAILLEIDENGMPFTRHLQCVNEDGSFYDLDLQVTSSQVYRAEKHVMALQFGDLHAEKLDKVVAACSWGTGLINDRPSLLDLLKPAFVPCHDSHDFTSRNHHNRNDFDFIAERYASGQESVKQDIIDTANVFRDIYRADYGHIVVVESNHDLALANWLKAPDVRIGYDPANAITYHELNLLKYQHIFATKNAGSWNALAVAMKEIAGLEVADEITFLQVDESFKLAGIEMGMHGHNGANGSRGNPKQFAKLGACNTGHTHTASVNGLCYTAGVSGKLDMGYNIGASSWTQSHIITFENGQRQIVRILDGKYCA